MSSLARLVLPDVKELLRDAGDAEITDAFAKFHAADIAQVLAQLTDGEARRLFWALEGQLKVETFEHLDLPEQVRLAQVMGLEAMAPIVAEMAADDRADFVANLPDTLTSGVIKRLPEEERGEVEVLGAYPEESAGGIMTSEYVALRPEMTVEEAITHVRKVAAERETIYALFVVDEQEVLRGVVTMRQLILASPETLIVDVMIRPPISMSADADRESVVEQLGHYDFVAMPIVDALGRMQGIVTHDDALDVAVEEATEDAQLMGGMQPLEDPYLSTKLLTLVRKRSTWLMVLFAFGILAGTVLKRYEDVLDKVTTLIFFLPLIIASGGNSGSQSATLVTRGLATGDVGMDDWAKILRREIASGLLMGALLGTLGFAVAYLWTQTSIWLSVAATVWITLVVVVTVGSLIGSLLPIGLKRVGFDPAITSAPLVAGLVDIVAIAIYVLVAQAFIPGLG